MTCEEPLFVGAIYLPPEFRDCGNLFLCCFFLSLKGFGDILRVTFPVHLLPSKNGVSLCSQNQKSWITFVVRSRGQWPIGQYEMGSLGKKARLCSQLKLDPSLWTLSLWIIGNLHSGFPLRPFPWGHPRWIALHAAAVHNQSYIYITEKCLPKKLACDWAGKLQRAPTVQVSMSFSQKIYFQFVIHKGRARDWDGVLWSGKQSLLFSLQLNRIHMTQAWHGGLLSCNVLLGVLLPWAVSAGGSGHCPGTVLLPHSLLQEEQRQQVGAVWWRCRDKAGWASCCCRGASNSHFVWCCSV